MPRPVFPVVRLPYDQPDRVARVLDAVRRELRTVGCCVSGRPAAMTAQTLSATRGEPEENPLQRPAMVVAPVQSVGADAVDAQQAAVDHVTVGVRDCTLTPKARPKITVTAGGRNHEGLPSRHRQASADSGSVGPYLLVPPVNVTAEISRPPLTPRYAATES